MEEEGRSEYSKRHRSWEKPWFLSAMWITGGFWNREWHILTYTVKNHTEKTTVGQVWKLGSQLEEEIWVRDDGSLD